ncbi:MAG TPA: M20 family metallopeptidase [Spirochaetia bacterium]|nr:M20 family metallopeptidase [Spirochaetia bacterium]
MSHKEPNSAIDILRSMVALDSVNGAMTGIADAEAKVGEYLAFAAKALGFAVRMLPVPGHAANVLVTHEQGRDRPWILFDSHLDTVSVEGMSIDPFGAETRDGRMWGRGSCDTKASGATMLWALRDYAASGAQPNNVGILYSVDEEVGMTGIRAFCENDLRTFGSAGGPLAGVVVGEPTRMAVVTAHNGVCRFRVRTSGRAAHAASPEAGRSAISDMVKVVSELESGYIPSLAARHDLTGRARCSINVIRGGIASNIVPYSCEIEIDRRIVPGESQASVREGFNEAMGAIGRRHPALEWKVEESFLVPPLSPRPDSPLYPAVRQALRRLSLPADPSGATYCTHAGLLSAEGIPTLVIGPGDIAQAHTADEWIDLEELPRAVALYVEIMRFDFRAGR